MEIKLIRFNSQIDSTNGIMLINNEFVAYTLEDEQREVKVYGETAIPKGKYEIALRTEGGFHNRYKKRFSDIHVGMLEITNVPNFEFILIHPGNTDENSAGCVLVGDSQENNSLIKDGFIGKSTQAYKRIYVRISEALLNKQKVTIEVKDLTDYFNTVYIETTNKTQPDYIQPKEVFEKLQEINGNILKLNAKIDGNSIN